MRDKIEIVAAFDAAKVIVNGEEVTNGVTGVSIEFEARKAIRATIRTIANKQPLREVEYARIGDTVTKDTEPRS